MTPQKLQLAFETARLDLLDLGLRNPLINYRPLKARGAEILGADPAKVFETLVAGEKKITFLAAPEPEEKHPAAPTATQLKTPYPAALLQARLLATYHAARLSVEERGVNTLYLALGMLRWCEENEPDKPHRAPLLLIPVQLDRGDARDRFRLSYTGEDLVENVSLAEKLKLEFAISNYPQLPDEDELDAAAYFAEVSQLVETRKGWAVETEAAALGFFSFAKLLMYRDLAPGKGLLTHGILGNLMGDAGFAPAPSKYDDNRLLDAQLNGTHPVHIVDADSSQAIAVLDAMDGRNLVIQGPPGTGKSQTIVNLIAAALAEEKKVLFVAEKMAALDVVKRRLDAAGLGAPCLVMHGATGDRTRSIKRQVIEDLKRTVNAAAPAAPNAAAETAQLTAARDKLNAYCAAVNLPIGDSGETPCSAYGKLLDARSRLQTADLPPLAFDAARWTQAESHERTQLVARLQERLVRTGPPADHPFFGSTLTALLPFDRDAVAAALKSAQQSLRPLQSAAARLAEFVQTPAPADFAAAQSLAATAQLLLDAPSLASVDTQNPAWTPNEPTITQAIQAGKQYRSIRASYAAQLTPNAWTYNCQSLRPVIAELGPHWWRFLSGRWRAAKTTLAGLCAAGPPASHTAMIELLDAIGSAAEAAKFIQSADPLLHSLFGPNWNGLASNWDLLDTQARWTLAAHRSVQAGTHGAWCLANQAHALDPARLRALNADLSRALALAVAARDQWVRSLQFAPATDAWPFDRLEQTWTAQTASLERLQTLVALNQVAAELDNHSLAPVAALARTWPLAAEKLLPLFEKTRVSALLDRAFRERPALAAFDAPDHGRTVVDFRRLDLSNLANNRAALAARCAAQIPSSSGAGAVGVLWREFEKKRNHLPVRRLMESAGHAVQSIKPVFMMSPLSIANFIPPGCLDFDLVVFDEASQVRPVDALGAIARGRQVVVVGDSKQLPPTSFFDSLAKDGEPDDDDEEQPATADIESILGLFTARGAQSRMLRWHYRSRHESLIAVSNRLFYNDGLIVFPSPSRERKSTGLVYRRLADAPYDRSKTRTNPQEARAVADAVMAHARAQIRLPKANRDTLGVAAFSVAQMDAIRDRLEDLREADPSCEEFFNFPPHEPFFVKNLENVQGDERDIIFISIGYGRTAEGALAMNFGPLNRDGGEKRMNVLITRARKRCEVFTSLCSADIDLARGAGKGVQALKTFLHYAETGQLETAAQPAPHPSSDFENQVADRLIALGHTVHRNIGCAGFFLDLAVVDPEEPGRYLLGVECDGARYHSARSARDRDRLRRHVLEGLGWRIRRIWSTDWFRDPESALRELVAAIELAKQTQPAPAPEPAPLPKPPPPQVETKPAAQVREAIPYRLAVVKPFLRGEELHETATPLLATLFADVVRAESPVHWKEAARRVMAAAGVHRMGNRIEQSFLWAIELGVSQRSILQRGDFLWNPAAPKPTVRDRSDLPSASRRIELIAPEEIREAILSVVEESYGMDPDEVAVAVSREFGFSQTTEELREAIDLQRDELLKAGELDRSGVNLTAHRIRP